MEIAIGLILQIFGVLIVLLSQVQFGYKCWRKHRSLKKAFFAMVSVVRIGIDIKKSSEEELKKMYPEWWTLVEYLREDIWTTAIGLLVTLLGLLIELFKLTLTV